MRPRGCTMVLWFCIGFLLNGCSLLGSRYAEYRYETPGEYYLYLPPTFTTDRVWPIMVGLHGEGETGEDCLVAWQTLADDGGFVLLCPTMPIQDGEIDQNQAETLMAAILGTVYKEYSLGTRFYMIGYSAGADFVLRYASRYPQALLGVGVHSAGVFPKPAALSVSLPFFITVGDQDADRLESTRAFAEELQGSGHASRLVILEGVAHQLSGDAIRLSVEFFRQVSR